MPYHFYNKNQINLNWCSSINNFGDELSPYLIEKITHKKAIYSQDINTPSLYAIGSILTYEAIRNENTIWGSGTLTSKSLRILPKIFPVNRNIPIAVKRFLKNKTKVATVCAVRGKLTRIAIEREGIFCPQVYGDPAIILRNYFSPPRKKTYSAGIVLHYSQENKVSKSLLESRGIHLISVLRKTPLDIETFVTEILSCEKIFTSSLHGLIVAHTYGVPAQWIQIEKTKIHSEQDYKFLDYFSGVNYPDENPTALQTSFETIHELIKLSPPSFLIEDKIIDRLLESFPSYT